MHTYEARVIADQATGRPLAGIRVTVEDAETGAPVQPYRDGAPVQLVTGAHGLITEWQTDETTRRVALTAGPVRLTQWCEEIVGGAQAAAERAEAAAASVAGERLDPGTDLDALTSGAYRVISQADAATILNRPPAGVAAQAAHVTVKSATLAGPLRLQRWQIIPSASDPALVWERHMDSAGAWSAWRQVGPDATTLVGGEDIRALQPGPYVVPTYGVASTLVNRPTGTLAWGLNPSTITVEGSASQARTITLKTAPTATEQSRTLVMHRDNGGTWSPWYEPTPPAAPTTQAGRVLTTGEDYHALPAGPYIVPTLAVGGSLLNGPSGALSWAKGAATVTVVSGTAKNASILLVETPAAGQTPRMAVKHRDNSGTWGPWNQVGATAADSTAGLTGEAALPTLAPLAAVQHDAARTAVRLMAGTLAADHPARWTAPAGTKLTIPTPDGTGQAVHPKVLDTGTPGWGGYRYWMAMTPYAFADDSLEDPCLIVSQDGTTWQAAPGAPTPLDDQPGSPEHYNSDTHLVLHDGTMYAIWRTSKNGAAPDRISWRTSTDGKTWTPTQVIYEAGALGTVYGQMVSPALIKTPTGWRMYLVAVNTHPNRLVYVTTTAATPTPADWSAPTRCVLDAGDSHVLGRDVWHIDVVQDSGGYLALINDCLPRTGGIDGDLILARSTDGTTWTSGRGPLLPRYAAHHDALYRGTLIPREDGTIDVWYSARVKQNQRWTISKTVAQKDC